MTEVRAERSIGFLPYAVDSVLLAGLVLVTLLPTVSPVASSLPPIASFRPASNGSGGNLWVDPPSFWMRTGSNVTLTAIWSTGVPPCSLTPLWYRWSVGSSSATGVLDASNHSSANFLADSFVSGTVNVSVRSMAVLVCGGNESVLQRVSDANITMVVPLDLSSIEVAPSPLVPGATATLTGMISGGEPPYLLAVNWEDGTRAQVNRSEAGSFSIAHRYFGGTFIPTVLASDAAGDVENASVAEAVSVGTGLEVAIQPAHYETAVNTPVEFVGVISGSSSGEVPLFDCSNATSESWQENATSSNETTFVCTFTSTGTAEVLFAAYPTQPGGPSATAVLYEQIVNPPNLTLLSSSPIGTAGGTVPAEVRLLGGVLPISLDWNLSEKWPGGTQVLSSDGWGVVVVSLPTAGDFAIGVRATDAFAEISSYSLRVTAQPQLAANAASASIRIPSATVAEVGGAVLSGCAPFFWWVVPALETANESAQSGYLPTVGGYGWNGSYAREGNLSLVVGVVDQCGSVWQTALDTPLVPILSAQVTAGQGPTDPNETLAVNLSIRDGAPPFVLAVSASDNEFWNRSGLSEGTHQWLFLTNATGSIRLAIVVTDFLGSSVRVNLSVRMVLQSPPHGPPPPPPPRADHPGTPDNATDPPATDVWLVAILILSLGFVSGFLIFVRYRRSRAARPATAPPDPVATLKGIIAPADGAERFTVELLAEEAGVRLDVVRSTIDRLIVDGAVHSETGADGEEVLSWATESGH